MSVRLCVRPRGENPFGPNDAEYSCDASAEATPAPLPTVEADVTGDHIFAALRAAGEAEVGSVWAVSLHPGDDPKAIHTQMEVSDAPEGCGQYVVQTESGPTLFLQVAADP